MPASETQRSASLEGEEQTLVELIETLITAGILRPVRIEGLPDGMIAFAFQRRADNPAREPSHD